MHFNHNKIEVKKKKMRKQKGKNQDFFAFSQGMVVRATSAGGGSSKAEASTVMSSNSRQPRTYSLWPLLRG
jgi:hypothetical protein